LFKINLDIEVSSFISIIGQSGSGKSTLMNIMGTLDEPTKGDVMVEGTSTSKMKKKKLSDIRNQTIGFVFQFHYLIPEFTALENILMPYFISDANPQKKLLKELWN
jgi:lipoprotein-releasing system ATP-binding protein